MANPNANRPPSTRKRMFWTLLITVLVFGGVFALWGAMRTMMNSFFDDMPQPPVSVATFEARAERWSGRLEAVGTLVAVNGTDVTTEAGGVVQRITFEPGQPVKAGSLLVELTSDAEMATLEALEASANLARVQADRWRALGTEQLVSQAEVEERATQAATARAQAESQRALIAQKRIRAPFDGVLGIRKVDLGEYLAPGAPIVSLQSLDPIFLDFTLPEQELGSLREGMAVHARVDSIGGRDFEGQVTAIEPAVDPDTRNFRVQATFDNPDHLLRPGAFARVEFEVGEDEDVVVIPQTAVAFNPYGNVVYVVIPAEDDGENTDEADAEGDRLIVRQRFIDTGPTRGDMIVVTRGLAPGESVVNGGLLRLRNDAAVVINNDVQPSADERPLPPNR
ncbi:MAG TPA: efflux RND transporter periplasmic adaptor subunit [Candidatus Luteimonas excrementigallinarum]|nr:efflux RND transporter periplasmic adaptor subunit [Candidatus Luteimonas excrementigallinarum]